ncbi:MAG: glycosyltransferase family 39 protein [Solirubrobacteraceae bacterium]
MVRGVPSAPLPAGSRSPSARLRALSQRRAWLPLALLVLVSMLSLLARAAGLGEPCRGPCRSAADHVLIFDEAYYVNAARVIAGLGPPAGAPYAGAPAGVDPNSEHPQLAKLIIAGSIELLGDGPPAWRLGSLLAGSLAIIGLFVLVRAAGGGRWLGLGAASLMAADNLMLVHGRIGTLDVYVLAAMIWAVALYLRGRPVSSGVVLGLGACVKLLAPYALLVLALIEALRWLKTRTRPSPALPRARTLRPSLALPRTIPASLTRLAACAVSAAGVLVALLAILDRIAPPYDPSTHRRLAPGPFAHLAHMLSFAAHQTSPHGPRGIASYPWQWLGDYKPIVYLYIDPTHPTRGLSGIHPAVHFLGLISPPILLLAVPALVIATRGIIRAGCVRAGRAGARGASGRTGATSDEGDILTLAWFLGTFVPFELLSLFLSRTSYLYYMLLVMPGIYVGVAGLVARRPPARRLRGLWIGAVVVAVALSYPFTPLP